MQYNLKAFHFFRLKKKTGQLGWFKITVVGGSFYMVLQLSLLLRMVLKLENINLFVALRSYLHSHFKIH